MKILNWIRNNILFAVTLFLIVFIPLYPKLPLIDIQNTWVYIRAEDFVLLLVLFICGVLFIKKQITLKTPLTLPIMIFWITGALATIHGIFLIFSNLQDAHPNVGFLSFIRRIEYLSLFFVAYFAIKNKLFINYIIAALTATLFLVSMYGFGQKFFGFPAYLTMNEEFAKGVAITLSPLSRVPSTFAGHYDLAAYLVLVIPILVSVIFAFKNWFIKASIGVVVSLGFALLFMTVSRVSFFVLLISLIILLLFQGKKLVFFSLLFITVIFLGLFPGLLDRFNSTLKETNVLVSVKTGDIIGHVKYVPSSDFKNKKIRIKFAETRSEMNEGLDYNSSSSSAIFVSPESLPKTVPVIIGTSNPTGEDLPQGSGYINISLSPITEKVTSFLYQKSDDAQLAESDQVFYIRGDYLVKKAVAYDLSFTTRFQGEWPRTIDIFKKNIFLGGGYGSVSLAVDNNYLRILGEVGLLGFFSFVSIFLILSIYIKKILPDVDSHIARNFVLGFAAGLFGLALNAFLIDVFEASKVAFSLWLLVGITLGILTLFQKKDINIFIEFKKTIISTHAIIVYIILSISILYASLTNYFFVGDDFTWLRWVSDCKNIFPNPCQSISSLILDYFTNSDGFFYRPGTKVYFLLMNKMFWLNQNMYHSVSILLHLFVSILVFFLAKKIFKNLLLSVFTVFVFVLMTGYSEVIFWISATGFLFNAFFILLSLLLYIHWKENKKNIFFTLAILFSGLSMFFHELGIVAPLFFILYEFIIEKTFTLHSIFHRARYKVFLFLSISYLGLRYFSNSHWFSGDYSYNILLFPFNFFGNILGYLGLSLFGPASVSVYEKLREISRINIPASLIGLLIGILLIVFLYRFIIQKLNTEDKKILFFVILFFVISLLPFLGLGNISSRYSYLSSVGIALIFSLVLYKTYRSLIYNGKYISISALAVFISIFSLWQFIQIQKIHQDWKKAGQQTQNLLSSLDKIYASEWNVRQLDLFFVNVPIRNGNAWVFPVGFKDAVWFVFRSDVVNAYQSSSVEEALRLAKQSPNGKVFEFDDNWNIVEKKRAQNGIIDSIKY